MPAVSTFIAIGISIALSAALTVAKMLLFPPQQRQTPFVAPPTAPKPADGKYNLKQNVPSLAVILGTVKKASDYAFLEETLGTAFHVMVPAGHRIHRVVQHYLHDEAITVGGDGWITSPAHFDGKVRISTKLGHDVQDAWSTLVGFFPSIWTNDHRGDGLAQILMECLTVAEEHYLDVYPQQMPVHTAVYDGALVYDPREEAHDPNNDDTWAFSTNLALLRLFHLTHPSGGKLTLDDMYLPDWIVAADVCDETVTNRIGGSEPRYHGGLWYRYENDPVEIGRTLDEAAELVIFERPDGKIGVHAGRMSTPDVRITVDQIQELQYDANRRAATTVLAVRGRWTDPENVYNTVDAAIFGNPYVGDDQTQRTKTVDNQAVQRHNHIQRLQKLAFTRANAPQVKITVDYDWLSPLRLIPSRRFVRVHVPNRRLDEAIVEIIGRPKLSLTDLTITFEGIVVPSTLYAFDAATEEGVAGGQVDVITPTGVPVPENFVVGVASEVLVGGNSAAYVIASWDFVSDALTYELEYQLSDASQPPRSVMSRPGETEARTDYLVDGAEYRFRLRAWSNKVSSAWTSYEIATATADATPPGQPYDFSSFVTGSNVQLDWINPNSPNLYRVDIFRGSSPSFGSASVIGSYYGNIGLAQTYTDFGLTGEFWWWIRAFNASEVPSAEVGPQTQTVP